MHHGTVLGDLMDLEIRVSARILVLTLHWGGCSLPSVVTARGTTAMLAKRRVEGNMTCAYLFLVVPLQACSLGETKCRMPTLRSMEPRTSASLPCFIAVCVAMLPVCRRFGDVGELQLAMSNGWSAEKGNDLERPPQIRRANQNREVVALGKCPTCSPTSTWKYIRPVHPSAIHYTCSGGTSH